MSRSGNHGTGWGRPRRTEPTTDVNDPAKKLVTDPPAPRSQPATNGKPPQARHIHSMGSGGEQMSTKDVGNVLTAARRDGRKVSNAHLAQKLFSTTAFPPPSPRSPSPPPPPPQRLQRHRFLPSINPSSGLTTTTPTPPSLLRLQARWKMSGPLLLFGGVMFTPFFFKCIASLTMDLPEAFVKVCSLLMTPGIFLLLLAIQPSDNGLLKVLSTFLGSGMLTMFCMVRAFPFRATPLPHPPALSCACEREALPVRYDHTPPR